MSPLPPLLPEPADPWSALVGAPTAEAFCRAWLPLLAARLPGLQRALLLAADGDGVFRPVAHWPPGPPRLEGLAAVAQQTVATRELVRQPQPAGAGELLGYPVELQDRLHAALVLDGVPADDAPRTAWLREVHWAAGWLLVTLAGGPAGAGAGEAASRTVLEALRAMQQHSQVFEMALALANHLAAAMGGARVAVGLVSGSRTKLLALSGTPWFERRSAEVAALEHALEEAVDQGRTTVQPPVPGQPAALAVALEQALAGRAGCVVPLAGPGALAAGALLVDRPAAWPLAASERLVLEQVARWAGPMLALADQADRWVAGRPRRLAAQWAAQLRDPRRPALRLGLVTVGLALAGLTLWPVPQRVTADAVVEGERELAVTAPFEAYIESAAVKAGAVVRSGDLLAQMDTRDLRLEAARWQSEGAQHERRYIDALARRDRAAAGVARAAMDESQAQLALVEQRLARAAVRAEMDGRVIAGDLSQQLGVPVKQGQLLFRLAPLDGYRVVLKVDERDIREVAVGQVGTLVLAGATEQRLPVVVQHIAAPEAAEGQNRFRVEAALQQAPAGLVLRPGMEGVGKIEVGRASLIGVWTRPALQWARLAWFRHMP